MKVGDRVHYYTTNKMHQYNSVGEGPYAAIVTQIIANNLINATVFPPGHAPRIVGVVVGEGGSSWCMTP